MQPLGDYISLPHATLYYWYDKGSKHLFCSNHDNTEHDAYEPRTDDRVIRSSPVYKRAGTVEYPAEGTWYTSVTPHGDNRVNLHYRVPKYVEGSFPENFLYTLRSFTNQNSWDFVYLDNDREWILEAICNDTLDVAHNGSYQPEISKNIYSTAVWVRCRATKKQRLVSFAEKSLYASS